MLYTSRDYLHARSSWTKYLTLSWRRLLSYRNQSIDLPSQWAGFYMITGSVMKGLNLLLCHYTLFFKKFIKIAKVSPALVKKLSKSALIWRKNALIVVICWLNFSFKMQFLIVSKRKSQEFISMVLFFFLMYMIAYQNVLIPRRLWPK